MSLTLRRTARDLLQSALNARCTHMSPGDLRAPAVVVAPHPDDETLGCGGTIARKRAAGADLHVVAMTDGARSHAHLMAPDRLAEIRRAELTGAAAALDVPDGQISWLGFPDGELARFHDEAAARLSRILLASGARQVFLPLPNGEHPDHIAARLVGLEAARRSGLHLTVFEYPIWFWRRWPWVDPEAGDLRAGLRAAARAVLGLRVLATLNVSVDVRSMLDLKRRALAAHRSQTTQLLPTPDWFTLGGVAGGEFLELFFNGREIFRRSSIAPARVPAGVSGLVGAVPG